MKKLVLISLLFWGSPVKAMSADSAMGKVMIAIAGGALSSGAFVTGILASKLQTTIFHEVGHSTASWVLYSDFGKINIGKQTDNTGKEKDILARVGPFTFYKWPFDGGGSFIKTLNRSKKRDFIYSLAGGLSGYTSALCSTIVMNRILKNIMIPQLTNIESLPIFYRNLSIGAFCLGFSLGSYLEMYSDLSNWVPDSENNDGVFMRNFFSKEKKYYDRAIRPVIGGLCLGGIYASYKLSITY